MEVIFDNRNTVVHIDSLNCNSMYIIGRYVDADNNEVILIVDFEGYVYNILEGLSYLSMDYRKFLKDLHDYPNRKLEVYAFETHNEYLVCLRSLVNDYLQGEQ